MLKRLRSTSPDDVFKPLSKRPAPGAYFLRVSGYSPEAQAFCLRFYTAAAQRGVVIEERIANPDERQLSYLIETLGEAFEARGAFVLNKLERWMPRLSAKDRRDFADAVEHEFDAMRRANKPEAAIRNIYVKLMCWLYYRFERLVPYLGQDEPPKIVYEGSEISAHELTLLKILNSLGADVLLVEKAGDQGYLRRDPAGEFSDAVDFGSAPFPQDFSLKKLFREANRPAPAPARPSTPAPSRPAAPAPSRPAAPAVDIDRRLPKPNRVLCTNAWMKEPVMGEMIKSLPERGSDPKLSYNAFLLVNGTTDRISYESELYRLYQAMTNAGRNVVIVEGEIPAPDPAEIAAVRRRNYVSAEEMAVDLAMNIPASANPDLQRAQMRAFADLILEEAKREERLGRLTTIAVYLICWIRRYQAQLFGGWKDTANPAFIQLCRGQSAGEMLFVRLLSRLPVDVLILAPDLNNPTPLDDDHLLIISGTESAVTTHFPRSAGAAQMRTAASLAEHDLGSMLYSGTGLYRDRQFSKANVITLQCTIDEVSLLWDQELRFRPNFSAEGDSVNLPVLFAQISGVKGGQMLPYWQEVRRLTEQGDVMLFNGLPLQGILGNESFMPLAVSAVKGGHIRRDVIKADRRYPFALLREDLQDYIFDKLQLMLDRRIIRGSFENGTEYSVVATVLALGKDILRRLQAFDFTKKNPKIAVIHTAEAPATLEDAIVLSFLSLAGFDVVLFVPTGYQTIARFINERLPVEHQLGQYVYDERIPDFRTIPLPKKNILSTIFKRGI